MGFWIFAFIVICVVSALYERFGRREPDAKESSKQPARPQRPTPIVRQPILTRSAETPEPTSTRFTDLCREIQRVSTNVQDSMALHMRVQEATKRLSDEIGTERNLIDGAMGMVEFRLQWDKKRSAMPPAQRADFDKVRQKLEKDFASTSKSSGSPVLHYRRPDFSMPDGAFDVAMVRAIKDKISALKQERNDYIAALNKKLNDTRFADYFIEEFERLGGPETGKLFNKGKPVDAPAGRTERENATTRTAEADKAAATSSVQAAENQTDPALPESDETLEGFILREAALSIAMCHSQTFAITDRADTISAPYLLHFTRVENIPSIMSDGLCPVASLTAAATPFRANDLLRLDGHKDAVSLSMVHPNDRMFAKYRWQDLHQKWAVLVLDPAILWLLPTEFNRHNAADKRMSTLSREERMSVDAFDAMFKPADDLPSREANRLLPFDPTDVQAELLVFCAIKPFFVTGIVFGDADSLNAYAAGLGNRRLSIHTKGSGFFGARAYARKTGWTY